MIPKIFHFINIGPREFNMMHFLSVYTAIKLNNPDKVFIYVDHEQENNIYWHILKDLGVIYTFIDPPKSFNNIPLESYQYKADIIRMEKLLEYGGIYMDLDILSLKGLDEFLDNKVVLGVEKASSQTVDPKAIDSITNAIIMAEPNNEFIRKWYEEIGNNLVGKEWAYHAVVLPKDLLIKGSFDVSIQPLNTFMPFCFRSHYIWGEGGIGDRLDSSYTIHLWETIWSADYISKLNIRYFKNDTCFAKLFRPYISIFSDYITVIRTMAQKSTGVKRTSYITMLRHLLLDS